MSINRGRENAVYKIKTDPEFLEKAFMDDKGQIWRVVPKKQEYLGGIYTSQQLEFAKVTHANGVVARIAKELANTIFQEWQKGSVDPGIRELIKISAPLVENCLNLGKREFKKGLLDAIGSQGENMMRELINGKFEEIGQIYQKSTKKKFKLITTGPLPRGTRFHWQIEGNEHSYDMYCIESPPQRRSVHINDDDYLLAFPWISFLVCFKDGDLYEGDKFSQYGGAHGICGLSVFYRSSELQSSSDALLFSNLLQVNGSLPFGTCLGGSRPPINLSNPHWSSVLFDWFWGSGFYFGDNENWWGNALWKKTAKTIKEVSSLQKWESFSKNQESLTAICDLPWLDSGYKLEQAVREIFNHIISGDKENSENPKDEETKKRLKLVVDQFREQLEEKIVFWGAHFSIPWEASKKAEEFIASKLTQVVGDSLDVLTKKCQTLGQEAGNQLVRELQSHKGGR